MNMNAAGLRGMPFRGGPNWGMPFRGGMQPPFRGAPPMRGMPPGAMPMGMMTPG